jgi:hypothetical protein
VILETSEVYEYVKFPELLTKPPIFRILCIVISDSNRKPFRDAASRGSQNSRCATRGGREIHEHRNSRGDASTHFPEA